MSLLFRVLLVLAFGMTSFAASAQNQPKPDFHIVGYLPDYRVQEFPPGVARALTDLIYFSVEPNADGTLNIDRCPPEALEKLKSLRNVFSGRLLLALGGWGRSAGFAPVASNGVKRELFARNITQFCKESGFDGVDFDWEHPKGAVEAAAYGELIAATKRAFRKDKLFISVTLARADHLDSRGVQAADRIQIMSYDHPGRHSTLKQMQADVASFLGAGVPKAKLCPGLPFYGRSLENWKTAMTYAEIVAKFQPKPEDDEAGGFYFNGIQTVQEKLRYSRERGLRGIMVWEVGQDTRDGTSLLRALYQEARGNANGKKKEGD